jgi:hypothetical protein
MPKNIMNNSFPVETGFKNSHFGLPEDGTLVPKHVADVPLIFVLTKTVHVVGAVNGML